MLLYSEIVVYTGIYYFRIFALKHRSWVLVSEAVLTWVLVRTTSVRQF